MKALYLDANPIDLDEPFSIFYAQMGIREIIGKLIDGNNPPLFEIFLHFWIKIFGISPFSVRLPSLLFSVINVWFVYLIAKRFFHTRVALLSVILITFSNYHLFFAHEARVYALFALLTTISFYLLFFIIEEKHSISKLVLLYITYIGLVFSHYFGIFVVALQMVLLLSTSYYKTEVLKKYFIIIAALIVTYAYYIPVITGRFFKSAYNGTWLEPVENLGNLLDLIFFFSNKNIWVYLAFILLLWGSVWKFFFSMQMNRIVRSILLFGLIPVFFLTSFSIFFPIPFFWRLTSSHIYIVFFVLLILMIFSYLGVVKKNIKPLQFITTGWFVFSMLIFFIVSFILPVFLDRYMIFMMPAFYISLALSVNYLFQKKVTFYFITIVLISMSIFTYEINVSNNRYSNEIAIQTHMLRTPDTKIIICPEHYKLAFAYHYNLEFFTDYENLMLHLQNDNIFPVFNHIELINIIDTTDHVIFIDSNSELLYPDNGIYDALNNTFTLKREIVFKDSTTMYEFKGQKN